MASICLKIPNEDRVGLVRDISKVLADYNINILSMEVFQNIMYIEIQSGNKGDYSKIIKDISKVDQLYGVEVVDSMPHQEREQRLTTLMDTIGEGIIAIDKDEIVTHFNAAAGDIVGYSREEILGKGIGMSLGADLPLIKVLRDGMAYNNVEIVLKIKNVRRHYLTSGRPIRDAKSNVIGAVAVLKAMEDVQDMVEKVTRPLVDSFSEILFVSDTMQRAVSMARLVARNDSSVMIRGESGTGKELFARAIHMESPRRDKTFAPLNCAALPDDLLESELFGYEEGAFTGAKKGGKKGLFEYASGGTIFFDEIGELSSNLQAKLLRMLQEGTIRRIGGNTEHPVDVRIIAATHRNLEEMLGRNEFREDLYYRLNVIPIHIPPLRERKEDLPVLVKSLMLKINHRLKKKVTHLSKSAMAKLNNHNWLGNVRELQNVIERAISIACQGVVTEDHIILDYGKRLDVARHVDLCPGVLKQSLDRVERSLLQEALAQCGTSRKVGKMLGLSHTAVLNKLKKHSIQ